MGYTFCIEKQDNSLQNLHLKIEKKNQMRPFFSTAPRLFRALVSVAVNQNLGHRCMPEFTRRLEHIQKSKVKEMVSSRFY
jgi:hypothetical protein